MKIIGGDGTDRNARTVYAEEVNGVFVLSPLREAKNGYRPAEWFATKEELEAHVAPRGCRIEWLTS